MKKYPRIDQSNTVTLYFDKDHKPVENEDDADIIEKYEFDDKGMIIDHETIEV